MRSDLVERAGIRCLVAASLALLIGGATAAAAQPGPRQAIDQTPGLAPGLVLVQQSDARQDAPEADQLLDLAEGDQRTGNLAAALSRYEAVIARFPNSRQGVVARQRILEVRALLRSSNRQATAPPRTIPDEPPPPAVKPVRQGNEDFKAAVGDRVFFDRGSAKLGPSGLNVVRAQAQWLSAHPDTIVTLEGHAEDDDSAEIEQVIALERAEAVKLHLMKEGIAPGRIHIEARGRSRPVALCREHRSARATTPAAAVAAEACFAHNRRVVSIVTSGVDRDGRRVAQDNGRKDMSPSELTPGDDKKPALKSQPRASEWTRTLPQ